MRHDRTEIFELRKQGKTYRQIEKLLSVSRSTLCDWFKKPEYRDVLDYIISIEGCSYYFNYLPLQKIGLPVPD